MHKIIEKMTVLVEDKEKVELKRELGLFSAVNMIIAVMIGMDQTKLRERV